MPLDREKADELLWQFGYDGAPDRVKLLDALEGCVTPRLAEVDVRLVGDAEAKLAQIRRAIDELDADPDPSAWADGRSAVTERVRAILDAPS